MVDGAERFLKRAAFQSMMWPAPSSCGRQLPLHVLDLFGGMANPILDLANNAQRIAASVGRGDVAGEFLVGEVRVVLERARWLDDVNSASRAFLSFRVPRKLGAPGGGVERSAEIDVANSRSTKLLPKPGLIRSPTARSALVPW